MLATTCRLLGRRPLAVVCVLFAVVALAGVPATLGLGWDEIVYVSQYGTHAPPAFLSAPRARGVTLLVGPVASWLDSTVALRLFLTASAATTLGLAFGVWSRLLPRPGTAAVAAGLYASLWITLFYANAAMPNHYTAMAAVTACGCFLLAGLHRADRPLWAYPGLATALAVAALMRPADAFWLGAGLLGAVFLVPVSRRRQLAGTVVAGLAAGGLPWVIEAELRYGGLLDRIREAGQAQGGTRLRLNLWQVASTLDGPILCRPCDSPLRWPAALWPVALAVLVPIGLWTARRRPHRHDPAHRPSARRRPVRQPGVFTALRLRVRAAAIRLPVLVAAAMAVPYLFLIGYSAPRFLLPAYALALIPAASGLTAVLAAATGARRRVLVAVLAVGLAGHLTIQGGILRHVVTEQVAGRGDWARIGATLHAHGIQPPCLVSGHEAIPVAYQAGCRAVEDHGNNRNVSTARLRELAAGGSFALLVKDGGPPSWAAGWRPVAVPGLRDPGWAIWIPVHTPATPD